MTNEEIIKKALSKILGHDIRDIGICTCCETIDEIIGTHPFERIIFSHDFAKAFWGDPKRKKDFVGFNGWETTEGYEQVVFFGKAWQYHLQQLVLEEEPLKYISKFLDGSNDSKN